MKDFLDDAAHEHATRYVVHKNGTNHLCKLLETTNFCKYQQDVYNLALIELVGHVLTDIDHHKVIGVVFLVIHILHDCVYFVKFYFFPLAKLEERVLKRGFTIADVEIGFLLKGPTQVEEERIVQESLNRVNEVSQIEHVVDECKGKAFL